MVIVNPWVGNELGDSTAWLTLLCQPSTAGALPTIWWEKKNPPGTLDPMWPFQNHTWTKSDLLPGGGWVLSSFLLYALETCRVLRLPRLSDRFILNSLIRKEEIVPRWSGRAERARLPWAVNLGAVRLGETMWIGTYQEMRSRDGKIGVSS